MEQSSEGAFYQNICSKGEETVLFSAVSSVPRTVSDTLQGLRKHLLHEISASFASDMRQTWCKECVKDRGKLGH